TASGAWYGAFKLLSYVQRRLPLPERDASAPAMELRAWNLWDTLSGVVERGNAGNSLVWPYALYDDDKPPHPAQLYSSGVNTVVLNDVNACGDPQTRSLTAVANWTKNLGPLFDRYALTPMLAVCFGAPTELSNVTSDPLSADAIEWWTAKFGEIYDHYPNFGGVVVKADSEGDVGPMSYNRTEADGANMLARVLKVRGGRVLWRSFIYGNGLGADPSNPIGQEDLARQAFDTFKPLDGSFDDNVILQIKSGPMDFQVREPLHPLLGGMPESNVMMEVSSNQGYTGHQIHVCNFAQQWEYYFAWDTKWASPSLTIAELLTSEARGGRSKWGGGLACVSNLGNFANYTAHVLAAANTYACGRMAWDPTVPAATVDREWAAMTFPAGSAAAVDAVADILGRSWQVYEGYTSPMGIGFIVGQDNPYGCAPKTNYTRGGGEGPGGAACPPVIDHGNHYWMNPCDDYDFSNYSKTGLGCDRTSRGVGSRMIDTYAPALREILDDPARVPEEQLLFFHNKKWTDPVPAYYGNATVRLFDRIRDRHAGALDELRGMAATWDGLEAALGGDARFAGVRARFLQQMNDAAVFSDTIMGFYGALSGL
ncbi:hypothetical protein AURANDRAFT_10378, partial [Aureococcus anophagefferens]